MHTLTCWKRDVCADQFLRWLAVRILIDTYRKAVSMRPDTIADSSL